MPDYLLCGKKEDEERSRWFRMWRPVKKQLTGPVMDCQAVN